MNEVVPKIIESGDCQFFAEALFWQCPKKEEKLYRCEGCGCYICMNHFIPVVDKCKQCINRERGRF